MIEYSEDNRSITERGTMYRAWDRPHDETLDPEIHATYSDEAEPWGGRNRSANAKDRTWCPHATQLL